MGKMMVALLIVFVIELGVALFISCDPNLLVVCEEKTTLFTFLLNPQDWSFDSLIGMLLTDIFLIGGAVAIVAGLVFTKYEFLVYAGVAGVFFGFGQTLFQLWQQIANIGFFGDAGDIMATLFIGGIIIFFIITTVDFARGRD